MTKFIPAVLSVALLAAHLPAHADAGAARYGQESVPPTATDYDRYGRTSMPAARTDTDRYGHASVPTAANRTIVVSPNTQMANVAQDEVVTFISGREQFSWRFDGSDPRVRLQQIAPASFNESKDLYVYVGSTGSRLGAD